ncbi:sensory/regulatory protein RpfC [mine drainage metagenome]|uniref:histidine kinase n=1 Tax=mine drainage metagenome TaxID=410659 RepID=A0A1J5S6B7_9ZZZZ
MRKKSSPTQPPQSTVHVSPVESPARSADELLHQLQVHQIELEMQNETLRQAQLALEESRDRYVDLYEFAPVGYLTLTAAGLIAEANLTGADLLKEDRRKLLQRRFAHFVVPEERTSWQKHFLHAMQHGGKQTCELTLQRSDGTLFATCLDCLRSAARDAVPTLRIALTDISLRKQFGQALQATNVELESAKAVAEKANRAKSEFLSSMSHELRTPLNAVLGFAQLLAAETPPPSPAQQQSIDQIVQAGWYLLRLINEILDLALIESGKVTMAQESIALTDVLQDCQAMMEPQAGKRGIQMMFPRPDNLFHVRADRTRIKQVMVNLLSNAIKYNRAGGTVAVECALSGDNRVRISVRDSGAGLAPEQVAQLFQPFNRLGQEAQAEEGTGIGLVVTKQLVELMGGVVGVDSQPRVGSVFWVELPAAFAPDRVPDGSGKHDADQADQGAAQRSSSRRTLLYVEDNLANRILVEQLIARRPDLKLLTATDGQQGIDLARASQPDLILMDINLPGISGFGVLKMLREDPTTALIPVIALSANAMQRDIDKGLKAGFCHYLTKPIKVGEFMEALDAALRYALAIRQPT